MAVIFKTGSFYFPIEFLLEDEFANSYNFLSKCVLLYITIEICRVKYLAGFKFSEAALISTGLGFNGYKDNEIDWRRVRSVGLQAYFLAPSFKSIFDNWNISLGLWLRRYIYNRITYSKNVETPSSKIKAIA